MNLLALLHKITGHSFQVSFVNPYGIEVEQRCSCGATRHHLFSQRPAMLGDEPEWQNGPHPGKLSHCSGIE